MSDGFYREPLTPSGSLKLGVCLPPFPGLPPLVAFPLELPMGWTESPPWFCAFTETIADLTNHDLRRNIRHGPHCLEARAGTSYFVGPGDDHPKRPTPRSHGRLLRAKPTAVVDVFVDDFLAIGQEHHMNPLQNQRRTLMHNIDKVFRPNGPHENPYRKEPQSLSKFDQGDASW